VKLGMLNRSQNDEKVKIFDVDKTHPHPQYNPRIYENDIALIKMKEKVVFDENIYPICLPTSQLESPIAIMSGFGKTRNDEEQSEILRKVVVNRFEHEECQRIFRNSIAIDRNKMLCYGSRRGNDDACRVSRI
jgi:hypothetical protein